MDRQSVQKARHGNIAVSVLKFVDDSDAVYLTAIRFLMVRTAARDEAYRARHMEVKCSRVNLGIETRLPRRAYETIPRTPTSSRRGNCAESVLSFFLHERIGYSTGIQLHHLTSLGKRSPGSAPHLPTMDDTADEQLDSQNIAEETPVENVFIAPSIDKVKVLSGESYTHHSAIPQAVYSVAATECVLGVDEAGRGPVLGMHFSRKHEISNMVLIVVQVLWSTPSATFPCPSITLS